MIEEKEAVPKNIYLIWNVLKDDEGGGYFEQFNTLKEAVEDRGKNGPVDVYEADITFLGTYKIENKVTKVNKGKK